VRNKFAHSHSRLGKHHWSLQLHTKSHNAGCFRKNQVTVYLQRKINITQKSIASS